MEKGITGLQYSHGYVEYQEVDVIRKHLKVDFIYVRKHQNCDFLTKKFKELSMQVKVVNIEHVYGTPTFNDEIPSCLNN